jgi:hypothetical protein
MACGQHEDLTPTHGYEPVCRSIHHVDESLGQVPKKLVSRPARAGKDRIITGRSWDDFSTLEPSIRL